MVRRFLHVAIPLAESLEWIFVLRVEDQHRRRGVIHEKLMHEAVIHLPGEIPQPDFALDVVLVRGVRQLPLRRPRAIGGICFFETKRISRVGS